MSGSAFFLSYALVKGLNKSFAMAVLVFLAAAAWTWVVASHFRSYFDRVGVVWALRSACCLTLLVLSWILLLVGGVFAVVVAAFWRCHRFCRRHRRRH